LINAKPQPQRLEEQKKNKNWSLTYSK